MSSISHPRMYSDKRIVWRPGSLYIPAMHFTGMTVGAVNESGSTNNAAGALWQSTHTSTPISKEISTFGLNGVLMNTDGMMVNTDLRAPYDLDINKNIYVRLHWSCGSTDTADTVAFIVLYRAIVPELTALAAPSTALDTTIAVDTVPVATAYTVNKTEWGVINAGTVSDAVEHLAFLVEMDAKDADMSEDLFLLGLELSYSPKRLRGPEGMAKEAAKPLTMLGNAY